MINIFKGKDSFLSNFYSAKVEWEGIVYLNNEAAFQSAKIKNNKKERKLFSNLDPSTAKRKGRHVKLRDDWEDVKFDIMYEIVKCKFQQNEDLKDKLLSTGIQELIEGNIWHDNIWGNCYCPVCENNGQNNLGKILMRVREELKER